MTVPLTIATAAAILVFAGSSWAASPVQTIDSGDEHKVKAFLNRIPLSSGGKWALDLKGDNLINYALDDATGALMAANGQAVVELTLAETREVVTHTLNLSGISGIVEVHAEGQDIVLSAASGQATDGAASGANASQWHHAEQTFKSGEVHKVIHPRLTGARINAAYQRSRADRRPDFGGSQ